MKSSMPNTTYTYHCRAQFFVRMICSLADYLISLIDIDIQCYIVSLVKLLEAEPRTITHIVQMGMIGEVYADKSAHKNQIKLYLF